MTRSVRLTWCSRWLAAWLAIGLALPPSAWALRGEATEGAGLEELIGSLIANPSKALSPVAAHATGLEEDHRHPPSWYADPKATLYQVLGVQEEATQDHIKTAYRTLIVQWHPDLNPKDRELATEVSKRLNAAWTILSNPEHRASYDRGLGVGGRVTSPETSIWDEIAWSEFEQAQRPRSVWDPVPLQGPRYFNAMDFPTISPIAWGRDGRLYMVRREPGAKGLGAIRIVDPLRAPLVQEDTDPGTRLEWPFGNDAAAFIQNPADQSMAIITVPNQRRDSRGDSQWAVVLSDRGMSKTLRLPSFQRKDEYYPAAAWSPDGQRLTIFGHNEGTVVHWDITKNTQMVSALSMEDPLHTAYDRPPSHVTLSPGGGLAAIYWEPHTARPPSELQELTYLEIWDLNRRERIAQQQLPWARNIGWDPNLDLWFTNSPPLSNDVVLWRWPWPWEATTPPEQIAVLETIPKSERYVIEPTLAFSPNGQWFVLGWSEWWAKPKRHHLNVFDRETLRRTEVIPLTSFDLARPREITPAHFNDGDITQIAWAPDNRHFATMGDRAILTLWRVTPTPEASLASSPGTPGLAGTAGLEERQVALARDLAVAAWRQAAALPGPAVATLDEAQRVLVIQNPELAAEGVLAVQQGLAVAFDFDGPEATGLEKLLALLPAKGPYAVGRAAGARFLADYPEASRAVITAREPLLRLVGVIAEQLPATVASALEATRTYLDSYRGAAQAA